MTPSPEQPKHEEAETVAPLPKSLLVKDAIFGLGFEVRQMRDTPAGILDLPKALKHVEDELCRIGRGEVSERDLIG